MHQAPNIPTKFEKFTDLYENNPLLPFIVWGLNAFGLGAVDRLLSKRAADFTTKRLESLINELEKRIDKELKEPQSENFMPAIRQAINDILESRSTNKVKHFASILANTWNNQDSSWDEVSQTIRLTRQLEDVHIVILSKAFELSPKKNEQENTFCIGNSGYNSSIPLDDLFPKLDPMLLSSCVSDLVALGLINDSFTTGGSFGFGDRENNSPRKAPLAYSISDLGRWLITRITDQH